MEFPVIDIGKLEAQFDSISGDIFKASQEWGFFIVTHHGIPNEEIEKTFALVGMLFLDQSETDFYSHASSLTCRWRSRARRL